MLTRCTLLGCLLALSLAVGAQVPSGRLGRELPNLIGVYEATLEGPVARGDVVAIRRDGTTLGEAFVLEVGPGGAKVSLKGNFACRPGDEVVLVRAGAVGGVAADTSRAAEVPDLCQRQRQFSGDGSMYCGPVAVSNSLMWLSKNGYPKLANGSDQVGMAAELARLMHTDGDGTNVAEMIAGIQSYLGQAGYSGDVDYSGWRPGPSGPAVPTFAWLKAQLGHQGCVWLNLGWYTRTPGGYRRDGGHWVTLVGMGADSQGRPDPRVLLVHDPSPRSGTAPRTDYLVCEELGTGQLEGSARGLPRDAAGYLTITGGLRLPKQAEVAIIDAALALHLAPP